jgi:hypothetical protein
MIVLAYKDNEGQVGRGVLKLERKSCKQSAEDHATFRQGTISNRRLTLSYDYFSKI